MTFLRRSLLALAFLSLPATGMAAVYDCRTDGTGDDDWLSERVVIEFNGGKTARVYDAVTQYFTGTRFVEAKVSRNDDKMLTVVWRFKTRSRTSASRVKVDVEHQNRASILKNKNNAFRYTGKPIGYSNQYYTRGTCEEK